MVIKNKKDFPTLEIKEDIDIAQDFAIKTYEKFNRIIKSIIWFGSTAKKKAMKGSDIDIIIILDDCTIQWDQELIAWYREELSKLIVQSPYRKPLHVNTVKLSTWWSELLRGEPVVINIIRWGYPLIDFGGFFNPLKVLLAQGRIKSTPESVFITLQRAPMHLLRTKSNLLAGIEGIYWAMVDSSHAALIAANRIPPSPEHVADMLDKIFVENKMLDSKYVSWYRDIYKKAHGVLHGEVTEIKGGEIEEWYNKADEFLRVMAKLINRIVDLEKL